MKFLSVFFVLCLFTSTIVSQEFYDDSFCSVQLNEEQLADYKQVHYVVDETNITEYYCPQTGSFKGIEVNLQMVSCRDLKVVRKNRQLFKLAKKYPLKIAKAILDKKVHRGFTKDEVLLVLGEPASVSFKINGYTQITEWQMSSGEYIIFEEDQIVEIQSAI